MYTISTTTTTNLTTERPSAQPLGMDVPITTTTATTTNTPSLFQGILKLPSSALARARGMLQWALPSSFGTTVATADNDGKARRLRRGIRWTLGDSDDLVAVETCVFDKTETAASIQPAAVVSCGKAAPSCLRGGGDNDNTTIPIVASRLEHAKRFEVFFGVWEDLNRDNGLDDRYLDAVTNELFFDGRLATLECTIDELEYYLSEIDLPDGLLGVLFNLLDVELMEDDDDDDDDDDTADDGEQTNTFIPPAESDYDDDDEFPTDDNDGDDDTADDDEQANPFANSSLIPTELDDDNDDTQTGNDNDNTQTGDDDDDTQTGDDVDDTQMGDDDDTQTGNDNDDTQTGNDNDDTQIGDDNDGTQIGDDDDDDDAAEADNFNSLTDRSMQPSPVSHTCEGYGSMYIPDSRYPTHVAVRRSCRVAERQLYTPGMYKY